VIECPHVFANFRMQSVFRDTPRTKSAARIRFFCKLPRAATEYPRGCGWLPLRILDEETRTFEPSPGFP
jgi:hypothetical protein